MKTKITKISALILAAALLCTLFSGCTQQASSPADTIQALEKAINKVDTDAFLACLSSTRAQQLRGILALTVGQSGISVEDFFSAMQFVLPILPLASKGAIQSQDLPKISLTADQVEQDEATAAVTLSGDVRWADNHQGFSATVNMELEDGRWVICGIQ